MARDTRTDEERQSLAEQHDYDTNGGCDCEQVCMPVARRNGWTYP